jgi:hypothetical protein
MPIKLKTSDGWKNLSSIKLKVGSQWKNITAALLKVGSDWKVIFGIAGPTIDFPLEITRSSASWPSTLTGKNYHWNDADTLTYKFQESLINSTDNDDWTDLMSYTTILNPLLGSSNTKTFSITSANFSSTVRSKWFRFVVKAVDTPKSLTTIEYSDAVNISKTSLVGTPGTVVIERDSASSYVHRVTDNGTWSSTPVSYRYQWQQFIDNDWDEISGATLVFKDMANFTNKEIRCQVWAIDDTGAESALPINSNVLTVVPNPEIISGPIASSITSSSATLTWSSSLQATYSLSIDGAPSSPYTGTTAVSRLINGLSASTTYPYALSITSNLGQTVSQNIYNTITGASTTGSVVTYITNNELRSGQTVRVTGISPSAYNITGTVASATKTSFSINGFVNPGTTYSSGGVASAIFTTADAAPIISGISVSSTTVAPGSASGISISSSSNIGTASWTNGSNTSFANLFSASGSGSGGAGVNPTSLATSGTFNIISTGIADIVIRAVNNNKTVDATWTQSGAQSYSVAWTISGAGTGTTTGNSSDTNPSARILSDTTARIVTINSITVYSGLNQTGIATTLSSTASVTAANNSTDTYGSGSVTYTVPAPGTPTFFTASTGRADGVELAFSGSSNATSYDIYWNILSATRPASSVTPDFASVSSTFLDTTIPANSSRQYWVRGKNAQGTSEWFPTESGSSGRVGSRGSTPPFFPPFFPFFPPSFGAV